MSTTINSSLIPSPQPPQTPTPPSQIRSHSATQLSTLGHRAVAGLLGDRRSRVSPSAPRKAPDPIRPPAQKSLRSVAPMSFLLGKWCEEGEGTFPTIAPFRYGEEILFSHHLSKHGCAQPVISYTQRTWKATSGDPMDVESGYWRPRPDGSVEVVIAQSTCLTEVQKTWFIKWPKVMRMQRQRRILKQRLKVPPALHQFTHTLDKNLAINSSLIPSPQPPQTPTPPSLPPSQIRSHSAAQLSTLGRRVVAGLLGDRRSRVSPSAPRKAPDPIRLPAQKSLQSVAPMSFLLGKWREEGEGTFPTTAPFRYGEEILFSHHLSKAPSGDPMDVESGYWRPRPDGSVEVVIAQSTCLTEVQKTWFIKWPKVMRMQRQHRILKQRLKVPPALHQFTHTLDKNLVKDMNKYDVHDNGRSFTKKLEVRNR
ncbi:hypothetical protein ZWY2020_053624 [Hordeum vulgare]|nr:hypothetical protein ZWY2020_053624 [Hordeum vulgare]